MRRVSQPALAWLTAAFMAVFGAGLLAGQLLQQYDARVGFDHEADLIAQVLGVGTGMTVGDVRAGTGRWSIDFARRVGPSGQVYATAGPNPAHELASTVAQAGFDNVSIITSTPGSSRTRLPQNCCDGVLLRFVYHNLREDRQGIARALFTDVKPGGRVAVIDFDRGTAGFQGGGRGVAREVVVAEFSQAGFRLADSVEVWPRGAYCVVFERPNQPARN